jgi:UDP-2,3-diacylglucosamine pyrophosphatase LpxH
LPQVNAVKKLMTKYNTSQIIHGHIHNVEIANFTINNQKMSRISLGEWNDAGGSVLIYYPDGQYEFKNFK